MAAMSLTEAIRVLGVEPGLAFDAVRAVYRDRLRVTHPDVSTGTDADGRTALLTTAFATISAAVRASGRDVVPSPPAPTSPGPQPDPASRPWLDDLVEAADVDGDTIAIGAPATEAFALLLEAASEVGSIGYVDRHLGMLEVMVRFEGGPTCSVLITLQGRTFGTDAFCTMDSIEAAPTPPLRPVVEALVAAISRPR